MIEDDHALALGLRINLEAEGYEVIHTTTAEDGLSFIEGSCTDMVVLDLMLPGMDGMEALSRIRRHNLKLPVLILTAKSSMEEKVQGLRAGADDYLTKPFNLEEFLLRVRRMLARYEWYRTEGILRVGDLMVDFNTLEIIDDTGATVRITPHEGRLIQYLSTHQDRIVTRSELLKHVWGVDPDIETRTVDTFVSRIRRYLEKDPAKPQYIISIRGKGYRFMP
ncbi:MAG: response regulator transcription factor [Desulfomonilia bacterium]|nr:response regulator transcription factor [Desulfomonilia bacterium]